MNKQPMWLTVPALTKFLMNHYKENLPKTTETWNKATLEGQAEELAMEISEARQDLMNQGIQALQAQSQAIQELLPKADEIPNAN